MGSTEANLRETFEQAKSQQQILDKLDSTDGEYGLILQASIRNLEEAQAKVSQLSTFSLNEEIEDVSTSDIQYLSIDYHLANLLLRSYGNDRATTLQRVLSLYDSFLSRLDNYGLLSTDDRKTFERFAHDPTIFSLAAASDFTERRRVKVANFQAEKTLKLQLEHLRDMASSINFDEEVTRKLYLAELELYVNRTFPSLDMITQENEMLTIMRSAPPVQPSDPTKDIVQDGFTERLDGPRYGELGQNGGPILSKTGKPLQPFVLTDKRSELRKGVFKPGHNLPTMSIDEYLEEEKRRGGILDADPNTNQPAPEPDEDNLDIADAATMKAREWDEFVEANPKGSGNTLNRG